MSKSKSRRHLHHCKCAACEAHPYGRVARQHQAINRVMATFDEKGRRRFAGLLALQFGRGGVQLAHAITGLSRMTIRAGREEIQRTDRTPGVRRPGAGRPAVEKSNPGSWRR
ncbi:MAG TPA: hypothetical protein VGA59_12630 [Ramlibacter sp.]